MSDKQAALPIAALAVPVSHIVVHDADIAIAEVYPGEVEVNAMSNGLVFNGSGQMVVFVKKNMLFIQRVILETVFVNSMLACFLNTCTLKVSWFCDFLCN